MKTENKTEIITIRLTKSLKDKFINQSKDNKETISKVITKFLKDYTNK